MMEDFPSVGFEGQVVNVKPGFARQTLIPRSLAVYNFPGVRARLFPNIQQVDIEAKIRFYRELTSFQNKLENISIEFIRSPSFANPAVLKDEISKKDIIKEIQLKYSLELKTENFAQDEDLDRFGTFALPIRDLFNTDLQKKFNFNVSVQVKQPYVRETKEQAALTATATKDKETSKNVAGKGKDQKKDQAAKDDKSKAVKGKK